MSHGVPWSFPKHATCNIVHKLVLWGEWNDAPLTRGGKGLMIRNKIAQVLRHFSLREPLFFSVKRREIHC